MTGPRRLLLAGMVAILAALVIRALVDSVLITPRFAVDLEIPLRAAERWMNGGPPYLASAFSSPPGATQPFLYPPYTLPLFAPLTAVPRPLVGATLVALLLIAAIAALHRLRIPWVWIPLVLAWPPFSEAIFGANIQMALFAAFLYLFYVRGGSAWRPEARDIADRANGTAFVGGLATIIGAVKVSQPHPWVFVLRYRWRAAALGAAVALVVLLVSVAITGIELWFAWLEQIQRAGDVTWDPGGFALARFLPAGLGLAIAAVCLVAVWFVPRSQAAPWVGILSVVGSPSLHIFGLLFLVPAMLGIRRELALISAILIATYTYEGAWAGILICAGSSLAATRWTWAREPEIRA